MFDEFIFDASDVPETQETHEVQAVEQVPIRFSLDDRAFLDRLARATVGEREHVMKTMKDVDLITTEQYETMVREDVQVNNIREANEMLYGINEATPVYDRVFYPPGPGQRYAEAEYALPAERYRVEENSVDYYNAAVIDSQLSFESTMQLINAAYIYEWSLNYPGTAIRQQPISVRIFFESDKGMHPVPLFLPGSMFLRGMRDGSSITDLMADALAHLADEATEDITNGYKFQAIYGEVDITKLIPRCFSVLIMDPNSTHIVPTYANGLTANQLKKVNSMTNEHGVKLANLDAKHNGYCLFETIAALGVNKMPVEELVRRCGNPDPRDISVEKYAERAANETMINLRFYMFARVDDESTPGPVKTKKVTPIEFYHTQTSYNKTYNLMVCTIQDPSDSTTKLYKHVFHMVDDNKVRDVNPFEADTLFINFDLETISDAKCVNRPWALNLLAYKVAPSIVTSSIYDNRILQMSMKCLNIDTGKWISVLCDENGKRVIGKNVQECAKIYFDAELHALRYLMDFIIACKRRMFAEHLNIVLVGFNSSRFDNFMLAPFLTDDLKLDERDCSIGIYGNSILTLNVHLKHLDINISTFDVRRHTVGGLRGNCDAWQVPEGGAKGDLVHSMIQTCYNLNPTNKTQVLSNGTKIPCFREFIEANRAPIETYCKQDVIATAILHVIYKTSIEFIFNNHFIVNHGASMGLIDLLTKLKKIKGNDDSAKQKIVNAMTPVTALTGSFNANRVKLQDSPFSRIGELLARVGVSKKAQAIIRALQAMRKNGVLIEDASLPFDIQGFIHMTLSSQTTPEVQQLIELAPNDKVAMKKLIDLLWENVGGKLVGHKLLPNIEQHPTLASFATMIFKLLCDANEMIQVGGFRYDITRTLRKHLCRAGRSEGHIGIYEDFVTFIFDIVSLYPTAMICKKIAYALGSMQETDSKLKKTVRTHHTRQYEAPVSGVMKTGIWKVKINSQPNGVVIPAKDSTGYHWNNDVAQDMCTLLTTPDVESLKLTGAKFEVLEGLVFEDTTTELYAEYISICQNEKGRQDALKKGAKVQLFEGEQYSAGIREAAKLVMNILSGKEITRPYTRSKKISHNDASLHTTDAVNEQAQILLAKKARDALAVNDLTTWRRKMTKAEQIPRLTAPPTKIGDKTWVGEWRKAPQSSKYSHINGYHIYGVARWLMTQIYSCIGYGNFTLTETDSLAMNKAIVPKLYDMKTSAGDPLVYANTEIRWGLLPTAPVCTKSKQFGQLECETTEKLQIFFCKTNDWYNPYEGIGDLKAYLASLTEVEAKSWKEDHSKWLSANMNANMIKTLTYGGANGMELILNGTPTGLQGPHVAVGGKKIYLQYLKNIATGKRLYLKSRFKGLTFGQDWVIPYAVTKSEDGSASVIEEPALYKMLNSMTGIGKTPEERAASARKAKVDYVLTQLGTYPRDDVHRLGPDDVFDFINKGRLYVIQTRVSESSIIEMTSKANVIIKVLNLGDDVLTEKGILEMYRANEEVKGISLLAMGRAISSCGTDEDSRCQQCDEQGSVIINFKHFCSEHSEEPTQQKALCKHHNRYGVKDCGYFATTDGFCHNHSDYKHDIDISVYCDNTSIVNGVETKCNELAEPEGLMRGLHKCAQHLEKDSTLSGVRCKFMYKYMKPGCDSTHQCLSDSCAKAIQLGYQLCSHCNKKKNRLPHAALDEATKNKYLARLSAELQGRLVSTVAPGTVRYCQQLTKKVLCNQPIEAPGPGVTMCKRHSDRIEALARIAASKAARAST